MKSYFLLILGVCATFLMADAAVDVCIPLDVILPNEILNPQALLRDIETGVKAKLASHDPIYVGHLDIDITHPALWLKGTMDDVVVSQIFDYEMCLIIIDSVNENFDVFNLTFPNIRMEGKYDLTGNIGDLFDIFGTGDFWMQLTNFSVGMTHFNLVIEEEICLTINIDINLLKMDNYFYDFMNDDELGDLLNTVIREILPESISIVWGEFKDRVDGPLQQLIDDFFHNQSVRKLLAQKLRHPELLADSLFPFCFSNIDNEDPPPDGGNN